jgi:hypothetical protein
MHTFERTSRSPVEEAGHTHNADKGKRVLAVDEQKLPLSTSKPEESLQLPTIEGSAGESEKCLGMSDLEVAAYPELRKYREEHPAADAAHIDKYV